ncbi:hypothetical protein [Stutzerimonas frequens]|uniref:hypothetical protein n=1 Tax=Stutzerimonas frequens TaxID=2968969 RepID=UPI0013A62205|nr:hypothetical protein [Stutzerimonas frequens]
MKIELLGLSFSVLEADDIHQKVLLEFARDPLSALVYGCYAKYPQLAERTIKALNRSFSMAATYGQVTLSYLHKEGANFPEYNERLLTCPISFSSFEAWALIQVAQEAEREFLQACLTPNNEVQLTGQLIQLLTLKSKIIQNRYSDYLLDLGAQLNVKKLELQVQNRERETGGDFALLFEWRDIDKNLRVCPVIFQAKRSVGVDVDISQKGSNSESQLAVLSRSKCNPSYIFYNCDSQGSLSEPRLPTVKRVRDVTGTGSRTSSIQDSLSLSIFVLDIMAGNSYFVASSRREALNAILPGVEERELASITTFSSDPSALPNYKSEYALYLSIKSKHNLGRDSNDLGR